MSPDLEEDAAEDLLRDPPRAPPWKPMAGCAAAGVVSAREQKGGERSDQRDRRHAASPQPPVPSPCLLSSQVDHLHLSGRLLQIAFHRGQPRRSARRYSDDRPGAAHRVPVRGRRARGRGQAGRGAGHPGAGVAAREHRPARRAAAAIGSRLWVVHRLDRETSGVLAFARTAAAHRALSLAFERREVAKVYRALVAGVPPAPRGVIDLPLHDARQGKSPSGRPGRSRWRKRRSTRL